MTLTSLALRNAFFRNKTRSFLTVSAVFIAVLAFVFFRTVLDAWYQNSNASASDRLVTRNAISLTQPLPLAYRERIAQLPGVTKLNFSNWFGGYYKDKRNFFAQFAIDGATGIDVFQFRIVEGTKEAFLADRNSCLLGKKLAAKLQLKIGDEMPMVSEIYPGDWKFKVAALIEADDASVGNTMYFHWQRLNDGLPDRIKNTVGVYTELIANANDSPRVSKAIDDLFANSDYETHTETEKSFRLQFVNGSSAILAALQAVSLVILVIMALILGNTLAMSLRERTSELGAMRAIGFLPEHVQRLAWIEGSSLGLCGGLLAIVAANPLLNGFGKVMADFGFLSGLGFSVQTGLMAVGLSTVIGLAASAIPALVASRIEVVDALRRQE